MLVVIGTERCWVGIEKENPSSTKTFKPLCQGQILGSIHVTLSKTDVP